MEQKLPVRSQVPEELTWRLEDIYEDTAAWEADLRKGLALADELAAYEGHFVRDAETMKKGMDLYAACMETLYSFSTYASMKYDQDTANADNQALTLRAQSAEVQIAEKLSFIDEVIIDNMVKGAAGQAIQNMNLIMGLEENAGLNLVPPAF